jgi:PAS domain S-box-containing protein
VAEGRSHDGDIESAEAESKPTPPADRSVGARDGAGRDALVSHVRRRPDGAIGREAPLEAERIAHLAAVVEASSDAIVSKSLTGTIRSWNASATRIFGYTEDEIVGRSIRVLIPEERQAEEDEILSRLRQGEYIEHYETVRLTKDGRPLDVSLSISPIWDPSGRIIGASKIVRDISARKQAEDALAAANAKFESVFNQSGIFAGILDTEGNLRDVNVLALDACGYRREDVLDRPFWETPWWRGSEDVKERIRLAVRQAAAGDLFREALPYWTADGSRRIVDFAMHPIVDEAGVVRFLHPTGIDITDRLKAEEALRKLEAEERKIAVGLQRALLPARLLERPDVQLSALYEAGSDVLEVGGDWYDAFDLSDGRVGLTVGDVVGHGLSAAAAMGQLRTAMGALADHATGPGQLLERLDAFLARSGATDFATVCYAVVDPRTCVVEYASAGHLPMLVVSQGGVTAWLDGAQSPPLFGHCPARPQTSALLEPGSLLVLYSDGLVERRHERLDDSLDRLAAAARDVADSPLEDVCRTLVVRLGVDETRADDVAVLAVRLGPVRQTRYHRRFPARADELAQLRASLRGWLDDQAIGQPLQQALVLAVHEACANAVEHAYRLTEPGDVQVDMTQSADHEFLVEVRDFGRFQPSGSREDRGRGTGIMRQLTADFSRESTSSGTVVRFRVASGEPFHHG